VPFDLQQLPLTFRMKYLKGSEIAKCIKESNTRENYTCGRGGCGREHGVDGTLSGQLSRL